MRATIYGIVMALGIVCLSSVANARDSVYFFHNDHLGTPQAMTDLAGRTVWQAEYDPFGNAVVDEDPDGDGQQLINNIRFPGQYYDAETGLHYNYHRDYDPATGRYLQPDPIGLAGGLNLYAYVSSNPVNYVDPTGENLIRIAQWLANSPYSQRLAQLATRYGQRASTWGAKHGQSALAWFSRLGSNTPDAIGRYPRQYQQYLQRTNEQLQKAICSHSSQVAKHQGWLSDPRSKIQQWESLTSQMQQNILHHWNQDIARNKAYQEIAEWILRGRR